MPVDMGRMVASLDTYLDQGREDIRNLLSLDPKASSESEWGHGIFSLITHYRDLSDSPDMQRDLKGLQDLLQKLQLLRNACVQFNSEMHRLLDSLPKARKAVAATLSDMRNAVIRIEGRQRLQRALAIRRYHQASPEQLVERGRIIIDGLGQGTDILTIKTEIADLALLCERLTAEDQIDNLADLKDNKFKATLDRLRQGMALYAIRHEKQGGVSVNLIDRFETHLFGENFRLDSVHQTIIPGLNGLFTLCRQRLLLTHQHERLQSTADQLFHAAAKIREKLVFEAEDLAGQTAQSAERVLAQSWQTMLLVWMLSTSVFLILSSRIAQTAKRQINAIESANAELQIEIEERQRIENVLRQNRHELRKAKDELEIRVDERTAELKQANEQLGREIAVRKRTEEQLRQRGQELAAALATARKARRIAETERDRSEKALTEITESKRRLEILISDATSREARMVALKKEINNLRQQLGMRPKYRAPMQVANFMTQNPQLKDCS